jgi:hypothetical protein
MKVKAAIEVQFVLEDGQGANAGNAALSRGQGALIQAIERADIGRTGVRRGSTKAQIKQKVVD